MFSVRELASGLISETIAGKLLIDVNLDPGSTDVSPISSDVN